MGGLAKALTLALLFAVRGSSAHATHEGWGVEREKWIVEGMSKADIFHEVERCTGWTAPLPYFARVESVLCPNPAYPGELCLARDSRFIGLYEPIPHSVVILPEGNASALRHEYIHHLQWVNVGALDHDGPEWECD